ncbi:MAG: carboxypeptidase M32 [Planctomycetota bacterium]
MSVQEAYAALVTWSKETTLLGSCASVLAWEEQTYMPAGGAEHRGNQLALLAGLRHEKLTDPSVGELLERVANEKIDGGKDGVMAANIREWRRVYDRATKLPKSLVEELAKTTSTAQHEWARARKKSDFSLFRPWLEKVIGLKRREAEALQMGKVSYDALIDEYETGAKSEDIARVFEELRRELVPLVAAIGDAKRTPNLSILQRHFPVERQQYFGELAAATLGFDFQRGRLDKTTHPFCSGFGPGDCRITTRYNPHFFNEAFFGILHEAGHGIYEQGLDPAHYGTPVGDAVSLGIHESQSRLWENEVGRGQPFWRHFYPLAQRTFREALADVPFEDFYFAINDVQPSFIRVEADEVTYNLHILIRFEMEAALLAGDLAPADVPGVWNEKYTKYLGITPQNDAEGCLQDIHWSAGLVGYFPTYTLGNLYGAQLYLAAEKDLGSFEEPFARGDFRGLFDWMSAKIYRHGKRYLPTELIEKGTGAPPSSRPLLQLLRAKFGTLYDVR